MAIVIDNDGVKFMEGFRELCKKYVSSASLIGTVRFNDGNSIGMKTLWEVGLGIRRIEDSIGNV